MTENAVKSKPLDQLKKLQEKYDVMGQDLVVVPGWFAILRLSYLLGLYSSGYAAQSSESQNEFSRRERGCLSSITRSPSCISNSSCMSWSRYRFAESLDEAFFIERLDRVVRYFPQPGKLVRDHGRRYGPRAVLKFRMALLPASGFQSAQYRFIEISSAQL